MVANPQKPRAKRTRLTLRADGTLERGLFRGRARDLSATGAFLEIEPQLEEGWVFLENLSELLRIGDALELRIDVLGELKAEVRWVGNHPAYDCWGIGVQFREILEHAALG